MQKMKNYMNRISKSKFVKDVGIVFSENILTKCLNFIIIILLTRLLGPADYGKYSFIFVAMAMISSIADLGMENTAIRFSGKEKDLKNNIFGLYFLTKMIILFSVVLILILFGKDIFVALHKQEIIEYIPYLILGIIGESLFFVNDTYLQAIQKFKLRALLNISRYAISLGYIVILFLNKLILLKYVFYTYFIPLGVSFFFILKYIDFAKAYIKNKINKSLFLDILHYEKWMAILSIGNNILSRIDFLMISFWVGYAQIGIYNAAFQLTAIVSFLPYVLGKVMLPKMAEMGEQEIFNKTKQIIKPIIGAVILILCLIPLTPWIVPLVLGAQYEPCIIILQILLIAFTITFITMPLEQAFYSLGKPFFITAGKYIQIFVIVTMNIITIPKFGILSAAINVLLARIVFLMFIGFLFCKEKKRMELCYE